MTGGPASLFPIFTSSNFGVWTAVASRSSHHPSTNNGSAKSSSGLAVAESERGTHVAPEGVQLELKQKDQLIQALTEQLEQAAEQLDRLHRTGADRVRGPTSGGLSAGMVDEQKRTLEELQRVVQQWEDMQAGLTLGRIEIQIAELRDLFVQGQHSSGRSESPNVRLSTDRQIHQEETEYQSDSTIDEAAPTDSAWEQLKSQLLSGEADEAAISNWESADQPLPDHPEMLDPQTSDLEILRSAVAERDEYISLLLSRLRTLEVIQPAERIAAMNVESPEFGERVQQLEQRLEEHLRCAEVELSVERAKLARDRSQLNHQQEHLERQLKKLGLSSVEEIDPNQVPSANSQERRWARFLGKPKNE